MISIREMTAADEGAVMEMVDRFYHSPAVEHEVDPAVLRRSFQAAVDPAEPLIQGLVLYLAIIVVLCNFAVDLVYSLIDPRIRLK